MAVLQYNITGDSTQSLLLAGDAGSISAIHIANVAIVAPVEVDLYIEKSGVGKFYIIKGKSIANGDRLSIADSSIRFNNAKGEWGLYIKLGASTSAVDIIMS